jgi:hypothetical protein
MKGSVFLVVMILAEIDECLQRRHNPHDENMKLFVDEYKTRLHASHRNCSNGAFSFSSS